MIPSYGGMWMTIILYRGRHLCFCASRVADRAAAMISSASALRPYIEVDRKVLDYFPLSTLYIVR